MDPVAKRANTKTVSKAGKVVVRAKQPRAASRPSGKAVSGKLAATASAQARKSAKPSDNNRASSKKALEKAIRPVKSTPAANPRSKRLQDGSPQETGISEKNSVADRPPATSQDPIQFPEEQEVTAKTPFNAKELREFKELLLKKRAELAGDVDHLTDEVSNRKGQDSGEHSSMPIHMADLGTDNWEQEFTLGLLANEHERMREIDEALVRIENKTYGICLGTNQPISLDRLRTMPWAKYCIEYARAREEGRAF